MHSKFALFVAVLSQALPSHGVIHEKLAALPLGWTQSAVPSDDLTISLHIGLAQQNIGQLQPKLLAVSTPGNTAYGHHLDVDDVRFDATRAEESLTLSGKFFFCANERISQSCQGLAFKCRNQ